jgi:hypothetical protein
MWFRPTTSPDVLQVEGTYDKPKRTLEVAATLARPNSSYPTKRNDRHEGGR